MTGVPASMESDWLETARGRRDPRVLASLWDAVPESMRVTRFDADNVPQQYAGAFCHDGTWRAGVDLTGLPESLRREVVWCVLRLIELGARIPTPTLSMLVRRIGEVVADRRGHPPISLLELSEDEWRRRIQRAVRRRTGALPAPSTMRNLSAVLTRMMGLLADACDPGPWWRRDRWNPLEEKLIPLRDHEPMGRYPVRFDRIQTPWLRRGLQWHCKVGLDTGLLRWSTVHRRIVAVSEFDRFLRARHILGPWLADNVAAVRTLMLDFLADLRVRDSRRGPGLRLSPGSVQRMAGDVEQFYLFMVDNKDAAAAALAEPGWLRLGPEHARFFRRGELPGKPRPRLEDKIIDDDAMTAIMGGLGRLADPVAEGGFGDEQAMRITMLVALLGRRVSEICMLDRDPLLPLGPVNPPDSGEAAQNPTAAVAKLRYQQTKIDGAPDTILVHSEVVAIIQRQQEWAAAFHAEHGKPGTTPKYLFLATRMNRNADRPYSDRTLRGLLSKLAAELDVRDSTGAVVDFNRTHRFRHTIATSLLNSGVPLHVLQRYLGHLTPTMTMTYAQTLAATAEAEFLRYRKITADARELALDPRDLYDMLELDRHTDRVLPNGWCLLPPRQVCAKGNACLTCDKFATDVTFLPELRTQRARTAELINHRREVFHARTGQPLGEDNVWLSGRRQEHDALGRIIVTLEQAGSAAAPAVRGAGVQARTDAATTESDRK